MAITIIEINDYQLSITQEDVSYTEIGCCLLNANEILFGQQAWLQRQIFPQQSFYHYWHQLGYEKVVSDHNEVKHYADLAYMQLQHLLQQVEAVSEVVFVVSGQYTQEQLSLLLGIAQACQLTVLAVFNNAVAQVASLTDAVQYRRAVLLDIGLHHSNLGEVMIGNEASLVRFQSFNQQGYFALIKQLALWVNQRFIVEYRYDAFHCAETEQQVLNQVAELLICHGTNFRVSIKDSSGVEKSLLLNQQQIEQQLALFYKALFVAIPDDCQVYLSANLADLVPKSLRALSWQVSGDEVTHSSISQYCQHNHLSDKTSLITQLPLNRLKQSAALSTVQPCAIASHVVYQGLVYSLTSQTCQLPYKQHNGELLPHKDVVVELKADNHQWHVHILTDCLVLINDHIAVNGQIVGQGDHIQIGDQQAGYTLVSLAKGGASYGN